MKIKEKINTWIFDLDNTLYSADSGVFQQVHQLMGEFISGGMKPKIETCINAMGKGVEKSTILDGRIPHSVILELFTEHGIGTQLV